MTVDSLQHILNIIPLFLEGYHSVWLPLFTYGLLNIDLWQF